MTNYRFKTFKGTVSSVGPLMIMNGDTQGRVVTFKGGTDKDPRFLSAYLMGDEADDCIIPLGKTLEVHYMLSKGLRVIFDIRQKDPTVVSSVNSSEANSHKKGDVPFTTFLLPVVPF